MDLLHGLPLYVNLKEYGVKPSDIDQEDSRQEDKDNPGVLESNSKGVE